MSPVTVLKELDCSVHTTSMGALLPPFHTKFMSSEMIEQLLEYIGIYIQILILWQLNALLPVGLQLQARSSTVPARTDKGSVISANWPIIQIENQEIEYSCMQFGVV